jgi:hypothetical protein
MNDPTNPIEAYKAIIDQLVNVIRLMGSSGRVAKSGRFSKAPAHAPINKFVEELSPPDRLLLSEMLQQERHSAIHDVLAALSGWIDAKDVGLTFRNEPMPVDLSGMGLHGDYIGRLDGWEWPSKELK